MDIQKNNDEKMATKNNSLEKKSEDSMAHNTLVPEQKKDDTTSRYNFAESDLIDSSTEITRTDEDTKVSAHTKIAFKGIRSNKSEPLEDNGNFTENDFLDAFSAKARSMDTDNFSDTLSGRAKNASDKLPREFDRFSISAVAERGLRGLEKFDKKTTQEKMDWKEKVYPSAQSSDTVEAANDTNLDDDNAYQSYSGASESSLPETYRQSYRAQSPDYSGSKAVTSATPYRDRYARSYNQRYDEEFENEVNDYRQSFRETYRDSSPRDTASPHREIFKEPHSEAFNELKREALREPNRTKQPPLAQGIEQLHDGDMIMLSDLIDTNTGSIRTDIGALPHKSDVPTAQVSSASDRYVSAHSPDIIAEAQPADYKHTLATSLPRTSKIPPISSVRVEDLSVTQEDPVTEHISLNTLKDAASKQAKASSQDTSNARKNKHSRKPKKVTSDDVTILEPLEARANDAAYVKRKSYKLPVFMTLFSVTAMLVIAALIWKVQLQSQVIANNMDQSAKVEELNKRVKVLSEQNEILAQQVDNLSLMRDNSMVLQQPEQNPDMAQGGSGDVPPIPEDGTDAATNTPAAAVQQEQSTETPNAQTQVPPAETQVQPTGTETETADTAVQTDNPNDSEQSPATEGEDGTQEQPVEYYTVKAGDSFSKISMDYYGDYKQYQKILDANNFNENKVLKPGDKIIIPPK